MLGYIFISDDENFARTFKKNNIVRDQWVEKHDKVQFNFSLMIKVG